MTDYADWTKNLIADIRANGRPTSGYFEGRPVMVLTTTGSKSGEPRTAVVSFSRDGEDYVVVGSKSGEPDDPAWFTNLVANPVVTVEAGGQTFTRQITGGRGYLSQSELVLTVGIGATAKADKVTVRWPGKDAGTETWTNLDAGKTHVLKQGEAK